MIKKIQLRGISRTPSDRMTEDGGLAESLNAHIEDSESAPTLPPVDVTEAEGLPTGEDYDILYIHKTSTYKNYICSRKIYKNEGYILPDGFADYNVFWNIDDVFAYKGTSGGSTYLNLDYTRAEELGYIDSLRHADIVVSKRHIFDTSVGNDNAIYLFRPDIQFDEQSDIIVIDITDAEFKTLEPDPNPVFYPEIGTWEKDADNHFKFTPFLELLPDAKIANVISLGNTIGIITDSSSYWLINKLNTYEKLGSSIPFPNFVFANIEHERSYRNKIWLQASVDDKPFTPTECEQIKETLNSLIQNSESNGLCNFQRFLILCIEMYDGNKYISTPYLIAGAFENPFSVIYKRRYREICEHIVSPSPEGSDEDLVTIDSSREVIISTKTNHKIFFRIAEDSTFFDNWKDLISSVKIYASGKICNNLDLNIYDYKDIERSYEKNFGPEDSNVKYEIVSNSTGELVIGGIDYDYKKEYLSKSNFYLIKTFKLENKEVIESLINGVELDMSDFFDESKLFTQERLDTTSDMTHYEATFNSSLQYNQRIIACGISQNIKFNIPMLTSQYYYNFNVSDGFIPPQPGEVIEYGYHIYYKIFYNIKLDNGDIKRIACTYPKTELNKNGEYICIGSIIQEAGQKMNIQAYPFIICPDPRCDSVDIEVYKQFIAPEDESGGNSISDGEFTYEGGTNLPMKEHPNLNCSYYYGGFNRNLFDFAIPVFNQVQAANNINESLKNKLYVSELENPFVFPLQNRYTFQYDIVSAALVTMPLSTGQFGQFPLYVFTKGGIWSMETNSLGEFVTQKPVNRYVATSEKMILSLENTIIFLCSEGLMLMSGSEIRNLSQNMNGRHWFITEHAGGNVIQDKEEWSRYLPTLEDQTSFMAFMNNAEGIAYDFTGKRLIFFDSELPYQYVFNITSNTWHKTSIAELSGHTVQRALNSYPDCLFVSSDEQGYPHLWNWSTLLDGNLESPIVTGILATRPFDLGESDILKTIKHIKIRGQYERYELKEDGTTDVQKPRVSYILLGSNDGITFTRLTSLRGKPWKMYRIIILFKLRPYERISWIDIDYETRHTNKLR